MARVLCGMTISVDGFVSDRNGNSDILYPDLPKLRETELLQELMRTTGAVVMGRHAYDMAQGDVTGYEFQVPMFVLTHNPPDEGPRGQNENLTVTFVTDGIESAIEKAKAAAGDRYVTVIGGPSTIRQCIEANLVDEISIGVVPVLLGDGLRMFERPGAAEIKLERMKVLESPTRTDLRFRVVRSRVKS